MFRGVINSAKDAASNLVVKYLARASVAVPFVLAAGFALAGLTVLAAAFVSAKEHKEEIAEIEAEKSDTSARVSDRQLRRSPKRPSPYLGVFSPYPADRRRH
jgi:hypothetical protein